jgi:hypothetical protein
MSTYREIKADRDAMMAQVETLTEDINAYEHVEAYCGLSWVDRRALGRCREEYKELMMKIKRIERYLNSLEPRP